MEPEETNFINYFYTNYIIKGNSSMTPNEVTESYKILFGSNPNLNCNQCIKNTLDLLKNKYIGLIKIHKPTFLVKEPDLSKGILKKSIKDKDFKDVYTSYTDPDPVA